MPDFSEDMAPDEEAQAVLDVIEAEACGLIPGAEEYPELNDR